MHIFQNLALLGLIGAAVGAGLQKRFGDFADRTWMPGTARSFLVLFGILIVYATGLALVAIFNRGLLVQRVKALWTERLTAEIESRRPDLPYRDLTDLAAWIYTIFCRWTYALGLWRIEGAGQ